MALAGNMKLSTFITIAACVGVLGVTGTVLLWPEPKPDPPPPPETSATLTPPTGGASPPVESTPPVGEVDQDILRWAGQDLGEPKKKDVTSGKPYKINVYQDEGSATAHRAKVDLDRDDAWDIKITYGDPITQQRSTNDDEVYDVEVFWDGTAWVAEGAEPSVDETAVAALPEELSWMGKNLGVPKIKDATKGKPYKINVYQDEGHATANRAKVDQDRDDKWDVKISYTDPPTRQVSSNDDEVYDVEETWDGSAWVSN